MTYICSNLISFIVYDCINNIYVIYLCTKNKIERPQSIHICVCIEPTREKSMTLLIHIHISSILLLYTFMCCDGTFCSIRSYMYFCNNNNKKSSHVYNIHIEVYWLTVCKRAHAYTIRKCLKTKVWNDSHFHNKNFHVYMKHIRMYVCVYVHVKHVFLAICMYIVFFIKRFFFAATLECANIHLLSVVHI